MKIDLCLEPEVCYLLSKCVQEEMKPTFSRMKCEEKRGFSLPAFYWCKKKSSGLSNWSSKEPVGAQRTQPTYLGVLCPAQGPHASCIQPGRKLCLLKLPPHTEQRQIKHIFTKWRTSLTNSRSLKTSPRLLPKMTNSRCLRKWKTVGKSKLG